MGEATGPWGGGCCPKALTKARVREDVSSPHPLPGLGWGPYWDLVLVPEGSCFHPPTVVALALSLLDKSTHLLGGRVLGNAGAQETHVGGLVIGPRDGMGSQVALRRYRAL